MARSEQVVFGLVSLEEAADTTVLLDGWKLIAPAGQNLVRVSLMPTSQMTRSCGVSKA